MRSYRNREPGVGTGKPAVQELVAGLLQNERAVELTSIRPCLVDLLRGICKEHPCPSTDHCCGRACSNYTPQARCVKNILLKFATSSSITEKTAKWRDWRGLNTTRCALMAGNTPNSNTDQGLLAHAADMCACPPSISSTPRKPAVGNSQICRTAWSQNCTHLPGFRQERPAPFRARRAAATLSDVQAGTAAFRIILVYDISRWGRFQDAD